MQKDLPSIFFTLLRQKTLSRCGIGAESFTFFNEKNFHLPASFLLAPEQPGRNDARIVQNHQVALLKQRGQIGREIMADFTRGAANEHEPRPRPVWRGFLGDQFRRKMIIKIFGMHLSSFSENRRRLAMEKNQIANLQSISYVS